jgi:glucose-1-phosphate adenylyltransferase
MEFSKVLKDTLVMLLAGGQGERLYPLTKERAKPAVPFGGSYRIIDFTLSNCLNSGLRRIYVLTQYKSDSLIQHIRHAWNIFNPELNEYIELRPPQQRMSTDWYLGTAHAIYQNIYTLEHERPGYVLVLSGDHLYRMDYAQLLQTHIAGEADLSIACMPRPLKEAAEQLGVVSVDETMRVTALAEKPAVPAPMPGSPDMCLCSMGVYVFRTEVLVRRVIEDAKLTTTHDFGRNVVPAMIERRDRVLAHSYAGGYWRDIGTIDAYWDAHMDLVSVQPAFNLYDREWPVRGASQNAPPAKIVFGDGRDGGPQAQVYNSLLCNGAIVSGALVSDSIIGPSVRVEVGSRVEKSVILAGTTIGRNAVVSRAIIDKNNCIPDNARIGVEPEWDRRHFSVSPNGIVAMAKGVPFPSS